MGSFCSPSKCAFFDDGIAAPPADATPITADEMAVLFAAQAGGQMIQPGSDGKPEAVAPPPEAVNLTAYAAAARYAKETGGVTVGTAQIDTSRESQAMIANAYQFMQVSGAASTQYKTNSGWVTVGADQMKAIALAVGSHVQACFGAEADLDAKITAGTVTTTAQVDAAFAALTA